MYGIDLSYSSSVHKRRREKILLTTYAFWQCCARPPHGTPPCFNGSEGMEHVRADDCDVDKFVGRKIKINRADEEFVGTVMGWQEIAGQRQWVLNAANLSKTFLPSQGWEIYFCEADLPEELAQD